MNLIIQNQPIIVISHQASLEIVQFFVLFHNHNKLNIQFQFQTLLIFEIMIFSMIIYQK